MQLTAIQKAVLENTSATESTSIEELASIIDEQTETVTSAVFALEEKGLVSVDEEQTEQVTLTAEGNTYVENGLPELRLYRAAIEEGADEVPVGLGNVMDRASLPDDAEEIAISNFVRKEYGEIQEGELIAYSDKDPATDPEREALTTLRGGGTVDDESVISQLERRGLVQRTEHVQRYVTLTESGVTALMEGIEVTEGVDKLTPEMLATGEWQDVEFSRYNVEADATEQNSGKVHILRQTAERVKDVLTSMGFDEMEGPHIDADFWIHDCLFMPQDHPARTHWDRFGLEKPEKIDELPADLVERVENAQRSGIGPDGEGYHAPWDEEFAKELALRGHTTSLSMRYLSGFAKGDLDPPQRYYSVEKVYRNDTLDPTHLLEFFQIEGWVMASNLSVRDLMGTFEEFYKQFGITDIEYKPHYNPYTEPSFELFGHHPETDELIEVGNSGMFRPEVLQPLGVECDVMAWGLSLERLLMLIYGFDDIRDVHGTLCDLALLRETEVLY